MQIFENLDVDKLETIFADLSNLSKILDNNVVKKTAYNKLVIKFKMIETKIPSTIRLIIQVSRV